MEMISGFSLFQKKKKIERFKGGPWSNWVSEVTNEIGKIFRES